MSGATETATLEPRAHAKASDSPRALAAIVLAIVVLFIGLRSFHLEADTPLNVGNYYARELYAEPPAKAHEARNYALFGEWHLNPVDNYQFWRAQSPCWVYPLTLVFMAFGTDYPQLRLYSTVYSALGVALLLLLASRHLSRTALIFAGVVLAIDSVYFHYARVGLLEPAVNTWIALAVLALLRAEQRIAWLIVAQLAFVAAFFTKQAALYALPVLLFTGVWLLLRRSNPSPEHALWRKRSVLFGVLIAAASAIYMTSAAYQRAVAHNVNHVLVGDTSPDKHWHGLHSIVSRVKDPEKYQHFWIMVPLTGVIATATVCFWLFLLARRRRLDVFQVVAGGWFVCACVAILVISQADLRYCSLLFVPAALAAAAGLDTLHIGLVALARRFVAHARARRLAEVAACLAFVVPFALAIQRDVRGLRSPLLYPRFTLRDGALKLQEHLGAAPATIVGLSSPPLVLGTPYKNFYVREYFNSQRKALQKLGITHILLNDGYDISRPIFVREFPRLLGSLQPSIILPVRNLRLMLYPVGDKLVKYRDKPRRPPRPPPPG